MVRMTAQIYKSILVQRKLWLIILAVRFPGHKQIFPGRKWKNEAGKEWSGATSVCVGTKVRRKRLRRAWEAVGTAVATGSGQPFCSLPFAEVREGGRETKNVGMDL